MTHTTMHSSRCSAAVATAVNQASQLMLASMETISSVETDSPLAATRCAPAKAFRLINQSPEEAKGRFLQYNCREADCQTCSLDVVEHAGCQPMLGSGLLQACLKLPGPKDRALAWQQANKQLFSLYHLIPEDIQNRGWEVTTYKSVWNELLSMCPSCVDR
jgi:hypothetical protein